MATRTSKFDMGPVGPDGEPVKMQRVVATVRQQSAKRVNVSAYNRKFVPRGKNKAPSSAEVRAKKMEALQKAEKARAQAVSAAAKISARINERRPPY